MADKDTPKRSWLGAFVSLVAPGLGHAVIGHGPAGAVWVFGLLGIWIVTSIFAALWLEAVLVGFALLMVLYLACAVDAWRRPRQPVAPRSLIGVLVGVGLLLTVAPLVNALVLRRFALEAFKVPSGSMCPTVQIGDHLFVDKTEYRKQPIRRGDLLVHLDTSSGIAQAFIRRVVAIEGDEVSVDEIGRVIVNGRAAELRPLGQTACAGGALYEEKLEGESAAHQLVISEDRPGNHAHHRLGKGELFLLGDERGNSHDSRAVGPIAKDSVVGRVWRRYLRKGAIVWEPVH